MTDKPCAPATERNSRAILEVVGHEFRDCRSVLEIGSGTGQHAIVFGGALTHLTWQTSDRDENHSGIRAWVQEAAVPNVFPPLSLDVLSAKLPKSSYDAVFSANTSHIMSFVAVKKMFELVSVALQDDGVFCLYGPFRQGGAFNTESNARFDQSLRKRDPQMGIRDLEDLDQLGHDGNLKRLRLFAMPASNHLAVWIKQEIGRYV